LLSSCIYDDGDVTLKLNGLNAACLILENTVIMLKRKAGDEWNVAVVGTDTVQLKYSEEITETLIKYVILDIQPKALFKHILLFTNIRRSTAISTSSRQRRRQRQ
jgi:hypothetical protein